MLSLPSPISSLKGVGPKVENKLLALNIATVRDLLYHFPFRWDDFSNVVPISQIKPQENITIEAEVISLENKRLPFRRLNITEAIAQDQTGSLKLVWFNQPYLKTTIRLNEPYRFSGKTKLTKNQLVLQSPSFENKERKVTQTGGLIPVYHTTEGLTPKMLRYFIRQALQAANAIPEYLPQDILKNQNLIPLKEAVKKIHFPKNQQELKAARKRLSFDELFIFQLNYQLKKARWQKNQAPVLRKNIPFIKKTLKQLPFSLTNDQKRALWEIIQDTARTIPTNRLLEGDVGSGKTIVAAIAALNCAQNGYQAAFMAPTEILARQHFKSVTQLTKKTGLPVALLTNAFSLVATKRERKIKKEKLLEKIAQGEIQIIIGTHAIIQKKVNFKNLGLVVVDEQHRFGVKQRSELIKKTTALKDGLKTTAPHLLSMTATPIPRTLALTIYGDLDISLIKEHPKGRKKIITRVIPPQKRAAAYQFIRRAIKNKRQVFIICPLIEESENLIAKAAEKEYQELKTNVFPDLSLGLLHGRLKSKDKAAVMQDFSKNKTSILVSTSVVEVGVDVPNATIMVIEGAERFGLSQLHQFRGRVGRGKHQSYCLLFTESPSPKTWQRLRFLENTQNGFELAKKDLALRGPGEFLGEKQSGYSSLTVASLRDLDIIKAARTEAEALVKKDPQLKTAPVLKKRLERLRKDVHFE